MLKNKPHVPEVALATWAHYKGNSEKSTHPVKIAVNSDMYIKAVIAAINGSVRDSLF